MEVKLDGTNFKKEVLESKLPVLVDFWAPWCAPCRMLTPVVEEITKDYEGRLKVYKVNVDETPDIASQYRVMSIPALIIFKDGKVLDQVIGAVSKAVLEKKIKQHV